MDKRRRKKTRGWKAKKKCDYVHVWWRRGEDQYSLAEGSLTDKGMQNDKGPQKKNNGHEKKRDRRKEKGASHGVPIRRGGRQATRLPCVFLGKNGMDHHHLLFFLLFSHSHYHRSFTLVSFCFVTRSGFFLSLAL